MYSIEDFVNEVKGSLEAWIFSHSKDSWLDDEGYLALSDAQQYVLEAFQKDLAEDIHDDGMFFCESCGWSGDGYEVEDYNKCPTCGRFSSKYDMDMCLDWVKDLYCDIDDVDVDNLPNWVLENAYDKWIENVFPMIPELAADAKEALNQIDNANNPIELLAALLMACHCCHVSGVIVNDYGDIESDLINDISEGGLGSVFGEEEVNWFMGIYE